MKVRLISLLFAMLCSYTAFAQNIAVTGKVSNSASEPIMGASVVVKGTSVGSVTDLDGNFKFTTAKNSVITVSYLGYVTQEIRVKDSQPLSIVLEEDETTVDEVVVVGVSMKKSDLTGAVTHVDSKILSEKPVTTINEALQGRVAGVSITAASKPSDDSYIKIRGTNTITSGSNPIYVVDGLVMGNDFSYFNSINVNDVESIEVLKDASATALYGSRGANGVVVVTTKKGNSASGTVEYDGWVTLSTMGHRPKTMNTEQIFELRKDAYLNGYTYNRPDATPEEINEYLQNTILGSNNVFSEEELAGYRAGKTYDWLDQVVQTGVQQNHNLSFSKSSGNSNLYFSLNASTLEGVVKGTKQQKFGGRFNADTNIKKWLRVGTNTSYTYTKDNIPSDDVYNKALERSNPMIDFAPYMDDATRHNPEYLTLYWRAHSEENNNDYNPFNSREIQRDRSRYYLTSSNYLNINPMEGLNFRSTLAVNHSEQMWFEYIPTGIQESIRHQSGDAFAKHERWSYTQWQWDNTVQYETTFNEVHRLNAMLGHSASRTISNYTGADGKRFAGNELGYHVLGAAADIENKHIGSDFHNSSLLSFIGRANYSYDYRYFLTVTGRYDGSSKFGKGHKWGFFPSFSGAWDVTNEGFMEDFKQGPMNRIKLRVGYGVVGNQDIESYAYLSLYNPSASNGEASYESTYRRGTPNITWEKQKQANIGLDLGFFDSRLNVALDAFLINNSNLLMSHNLPTTSGYTWTIENVGEMQNKGFEAQVNAVAIRTKDLTWNISANLSLDRNEITQLYGGLEYIKSGGRTGNLFVGQPLNNIYTYKFGGIANENNRELWEGIDFNGHTVQLGDLFPLDLDDNKVIDLEDRYIYGGTDPKFYGGFATDLTYKGFSLNAVFNYSVGGKMISSYYENLLSSKGLSYATPDIADRWTPENTTAEFPRVVANASGGYNPYGPWDTDRYIQSSSYLRLSTLTLAYNFQRNLLSRLHMKSLRLYFTASNVFTLTGYKGFDPEFGDYNYPPTRNYTLGVNISF